jgi:hypothetical protein
VGVVDLGGCPCRSKFLIRDRDSKFTTHSMRHSQETGSVSGLISEYDK